MATITGTHDISTLLAAKTQTAVQFGMDTITEVLQADLAAHNAIMQDLLKELAERTTDRMRRAGTSINSEMIEVDEFGRAPTQKATPGQNVGFPLRKFDHPLGWTRRFLQVATPADLASGQLAAQKAHRKAFAREIRRGLYFATNYTFSDHLVDNLELPVKRLVNADSAAIPEGPNGETFDGTTHTHYRARVGTLAASDVDALVDDVIEHGHGGQIRIVIAAGDVTAMTGLTAGFTPLTPVHVHPGSASPITDVRLDPTRLTNRLVGYWRGSYEVWTKPWAIAGYWLAYDAADEAKPLALREDLVEGVTLHRAAEIDMYPLRAEYMTSMFGFGVWTRTNGAVLYTGATSWADPTIN